MPDQFQRKKIASETGRTIEITEKYKDMGDGTFAELWAAAIHGTKYESVTANMNNQPLGAVGAVNDLLMAVTIIPASTSPGTVSIKDGSNTAITIFTGGASSVSNLVPFTVTLNIHSIQGAWQITTGENVSVVATGDFT